MGVACACICHVSVLPLRGKTYNSVLRSNKQWADLKWRLFCWHPVKATICYFIFAIYSEMYIWVLFL